MTFALSFTAYGLPTLATIIIAAAIFVATLVLIMLRPRRVNEALAIWLMLQL